MQKRVCPQCGRAWYSADTMTTWVCECGAEITPEDEVDLAEGGEPEVARSSD